MKNIKSKRCPECFWALYDGEICMNSECPITHTENPVLLTQRESLLMLYARGEKHKYANGYVTKKWMEAFRHEISC